jgi:hypothetical protein
VCVCVCVCVCVRARMFNACVWCADVFSRLVYVHILILKGGGGKSRENVCMQKATFICEAFICCGGDLT